MLPRNLPGSVIKTPVHHQSLFISYYLQLLDELVDDFAKDSMQEKTKFLMQARKKILIIILTIMIASYIGNDYRQDCTFCIFGHKKFERYQKKCRFSKRHSGKYLFDSILQ
jgi:hypothetical protein